MQLVLESSEEKETEVDAMQSEMIDEKEKDDKESKDDSVLILMQPTNKVKPYLDNALYLSSQLSDLTIFNV